MFGSMIKAGYHGYPRHLAQTNCSGSYSASSDWFTFVLDADADAESDDVLFETALVFFSDLLWFFLLAGEASVDGVPNDFIKLLFSCFSRSSLKKSSFSSS